MQPLIKGGGETTVRVQTALTGVGQLIGASANGKVAGSNYGQGTCLIVGSAPSRGAWKRHLTDLSASHPCFSPSLPPVPSL